jgi:aminotransferase EvaB
VTDPAGGPPWVPLNDLSRALAHTRDDVLADVARVVDSGWLVHGPEHAAFERELADYVGAAHAVGVASGTDALELALRAVVPADRPVVVTAANCGAYTTTAARRGGFTVRYADVERTTLLLDAASLESVLDDTVGAVVVTHLYGRAADVAAVRAVCAPRGVAVVEDCAQALGAAVSGQGRVGSLGDVAAFSFYPTKNLGAIGDGGAVSTSSDAVAEQLRRLRQYGWTSKYTVGTDGGRNSRLDELQAAVLRTRLRSLDAWNARRRDIIGAYAAAAGTSSRVSVLPAEGDGHVGHLAVVLTDDRDDLRAHLEAARIRSDVHYPVPDHRQPAIAAQYADVQLPVTEWAAARILSLPVFPELRQDEIERVCRALESF